jgi:acetylornithine deacetylase/succinyl-diaminopimelate desuccinylase-like protein
MITSTQQEDRHMTGERDAEALLDAEELAQLTMDLIDISSPMGSEAGVATYLHARFKAVGLESRVIDVEPGRHNVVGRLPGSGTGPTLLVVGHMDTTWGGDEEGIAGRGSAYLPRAERDGDWIYGMGAYNMKSGLATAVHVVEKIATSGRQLDGDIIIAGVCGETSHAQTERYKGARYRGAGVGARFLVTNGVTADFAVITEPTAGRIVNITGGYLLYEVTTSGVPGATYKRGGKVAAQIQEAPDAVKAAFRLTAALEPWADDYAARTTLRGQPVGNVTVISVEGGHPWRPSKVASYCRLYFEVDMVPGQDQAGLDLEFRAAVRTAGEAIGSDPEVILLQNVPGSVVPDDDPFIERLSLAHTATQGEVPERTFDAFHADTSALTRFGIPAVCYGPGGRMRDGGVGYYAREGEMCFLPDLIAGARSLTRFLVSTSNEPRAAIVPTRSAELASTVVR